MVVIRGEHIFQTPCAICHEKHNSSTLEQLKRIREFLSRHDLTEVVKSNGVYIMAAFIHSTHHHCSYGLHCAELSAITHEANNIVREIENNVIAYVQMANKGELQELLLLLQGYFPQVYVAVERYWYSYHRKEF